MGLGAAEGPLQAAGTQSVEGGLGPRFSSRKCLPFSSLRPSLHVPAFSCLQGVCMCVCVCVCVCVYLLMFGLRSARRCSGFKKKPVLIPHEGSGSLRRPDRQKPLCTGSCSLNLPCCSLAHCLSLCPKSLY